MMQVAEIKAWLDTLGDAEYVGVDEGGLTLQTPDGSAWLEIGGIVEEDEKG